MKPSHHTCSFLGAKGLLVMPGDLKLGPRQTSALGWDHSGAQGDHLGCPYPRRREEGREAIDLGLLPGTSPGQPVCAVMVGTEDGDSRLTWEHPNCSGDTSISTASSETRRPECKLAPRSKSTNASPSILSGAFTAHSQECHDHSGKSK